ncbi:helix-turn-helix transcriptional regulator [Staphylococcus saprophyticus]|uniref:helix-turn-helix domain-containing protein n=1 Tax=Staphylococcus saprophyticus TaxID=29385 RepID=UPI0027BA3633|nr:helix-turn-helix transcriptional regulator [Staphylococcus saprophyticus]WLW71529.1 helix-turn-helix transcriptional regulator [Staphylococcus saprophyticus]WLW73958.1 helix-turn-helix transcriptional regulator [Staphylococcus saprophyticus]
MSGDLEKLIKSYVQEKNISITELARASNLSQSYVYNLETGKKSNPKLNTIVKLANGLSKFGYNKLSVLNELIAAIPELNNQENKEKAFQQLIHMNDEKITVRSSGYTDLFNVLNVSSERVGYRYTQNNVDYQIILGDKIKSHIKNVVDEIIDMYVSTYPELLEEDEYYNLMVESELAKNKLKLLNYGDSLEDSDN